MTTTGATAPTPTDLADRLARLADRIADAAQRAGRSPGEVRLLLATKTQPASVVAAAVRAGYPLIGENRVQELVGKATELDRLLAGAPIERHFIGHLQANKINQLLPLVDCVQTVDSGGLAERLSARAADAGRVLDVLVQVNVSGEATKSGVAPAEAVQLAGMIGTLPSLALRGLMTIGLNSDDETAVRAGYRRLRQLRDELAGDAATAGADVLSMGMSGDFAAAIIEGATMVRIGAAAFGPR